MKLDTKTLTEHIHYAENLRAATEELAVTQAELARAIGKDQKTVGRYINGETYPEGSAAKIAEYLLSRLVDDNDFLHIPSEKFEEIFSEIYDFLGDNGVHEAEFARLLGISQKTLNNYHNHRINNGEALKLTTGMQYRIVRVFENYSRILFGDADKEISVENRARYESVIARTRQFRSVHFVEAAIETDEILINSLKTGGVNFFTYQPKKLELIRFYLGELIRLFPEARACIESEILRGGSCPLYEPPEIISSLDFLHEFRGKSKFLDEESKKDGIESLTYGFCSDFFNEETARYLKIYDTFSASEKKETNALLRLVFEEKTRWLVEERENLSHLDFNDPDCDPFDFEELISDSEANQLIEMFVKQNAEGQRAILNNFNVFFRGLNLIPDESAAEARRRFLELDRVSKLIFVDEFEHEILGNFWRHSLEYNSEHDFYDIWAHYSQYMSLMSWASQKSDVCFEEPSERDARMFARRIRELRSNRHCKPVSDMKSRLGYSPLEWYADLLAELALLKGKDLAEMLREIEET